MITNSLINYLNASSSISIDRFYPIKAKQNRSKPLGIVYLDDQNRRRTYNGTNATNAARCQIDIYGHSVSSMQTVVVEVLSVLTDYNGTMGSHYVYDCEIDSESNGFETDVELYSHSIFLTITYR